MNLYCCTCAATLGGAAARSPKRAAGVYWEILILAFQLDFTCF